MRTRSILGGLALLVLLPSCGGGGAEEPLRVPRVTASNDPSVLATINEQVGELQVDADRLYWIGTAENGRYETGALRSCEKRNCAASLVTYDGSGVVSQAGFGLANGQLSWFQLSDDPREWTLLTCQVAACAGSKKTLARALSFSYRAPAVFAPDWVYFQNSASLYRISLASGGKPHFVALLQGDLTSLAAEGDYLYWLDVHSVDANHSVNVATLRRARVDGSAVPEILAAGLKFDWGPDFAGLLLPPRNLAADASHVFWSQPGTVAGIARCPLAGCAGTPELFAQPIPQPAAFSFDQKGLYWIQSNATSPRALSGCALDRCAIPAAAIASNIDAANAVTIDEEYVYTATGDVPVTWQLRPVSVTAQLRRFPR